VSKWNDIQELDAWCESLTRGQRLALVIFLAEIVLVLAALLERTLDWLAVLICN